MVCPNGTILKRPTDAEAGAILGITPELDPEKVYDVAIVGAGPAGLAAAVYAGPRASRSSCSISGPSADRQARQRGSRTILAFQQASPAWGSQAAPSIRR